MHTWKSFAVTFVIFAVVFTIALQILTDLQINIASWPARITFIGGILGLQYIRVCLVKYLNSLLHLHLFPGTFRFLDQVLGWMMVAVAFVITQLLFTSAVTISSPARGLLFVFVVAIGAAINSTIDTWIQLGAKRNENGEKDQPKDETTPH